MTDKLSPSRRSWNMSRIRSKDTKPELILRSALFKSGFRFRLYDHDLPGKPDIVLKKYKTAIFVHGCFWHQHKNCIDGKRPASNKDYWAAKLDRNIARFARNKRLLKKRGWRVIVLWECEVRNKSFPHKSLPRLVETIREHEV